MRSKGGSPGCLTSEAVKQIPQGKMKLVKQIPYGAVNLNEMERGEEDEYIIIMD